MVTKNHRQSNFFLVIFAFSLCFPTSIYAWGAIAKPLAQKAIREMPDAIRGLGYGIGSAYIYEDIKQRNHPQYGNGYSQQDLYNYGKADTHYRNNFKSRYGFYPY